MHLNMDAVVVLAHHYLWQARRGDALVNTASMVGLVSLPGTVLNLMGRFAPARAN